MLIIIGLIVFGCCLSGFRFLDRLFGIAVFAFLLLLILLWILLGSL